MKIKFIYFTIILSLNLTAQDKLQTNNSTNEKNLGLNLNTGISSIYGNKSYFLENSLVYKINPKFNAGLFSFGYYSFQKIINQTNNKQSLYGYASGIFVEHIVLNKKSFKIALPIKLGLGSIGYSNDNLSNIINDQDVNTIDWDPFQLWEFGASIITSQKKSIQFISTLSYRSTNRFELVENSKKSISGISFSIGLRWYIFKIRP